MTDAVAGPLQGPVPFSTAPAPAPPQPEPRFWRVIGALWFLVLGVLYIKVASTTARDLIATGPSISHLASLATRTCVAAYYFITCWILLVRPPPIARKGEILPVLTAYLASYGVWFIAFLPGAPPSPIRDLASAGVTMVGEVLMVVVILRLGRSFSIVPQANALVTTGPYRYVRHPLYLTELIALVGILISRAWWAALVFLMANLALQISRMLNEEALLGGVFPEYAAYARRTARLIPGVW